MELDKKGSSWYRLVDLFLVGMGSALFLAGLLFLVAFNWQELHRFGKLGLTLFFFLVSQVFWYQFRNHTVLQEIGLLFSFFVTGILLLVFGQIYQTGADAYDLFFGWSAFSFLYILGSRIGIVVISWSILLSITMGLYLAQAYDGEFYSLYLILFGSVYLGLLVLFESKFANHIQLAPYLSSVLLFLHLSFLYSNVLDVWNYDYLEPNGFELTRIFRQWLLPMFSLGFGYWFFRFHVFRLNNLTILFLFGLIFFQSKLSLLFDRFSSDGLGYFLASALFIILYTMFSYKHLNSLRYQHEDQT